MRINRFVAQATGLSRRGADRAIHDGEVLVNNAIPDAGYNAQDNDVVTYKGATLSFTEVRTIMLNKPVGYVCSRNGQGSRTIYDLLPIEYADLKPVGRLDKASSGLLLMTNDGTLAHELTHPSFQKIKTYEVTLDKALQPLHHQMISDIGITLEDGVSKLQLTRLQEGDDTSWEVMMHEGRNRQIRRTFAALGYEVLKLHRTTFGAYTLGDLTTGMILTMSKKK